MNLQKTLLTTSVIGALCYAPVKANHVQPDKKTPSQGWFFKKKKSVPADSSKVADSTSGEIAVPQYQVGKGMFNIYYKNHNYYFEIPDSLLGRDMLVVNKLQKVPLELNDAGVNRGTNYETQMIRFEHDSITRKILVRQIRPLPESPAGDAITQSVKNNFISPLIASFQTESHDASRKSYLIKVNDI